MHPAAHASTRGRIPVLAALGAALGALALLTALVGRHASLPRADFVFANGGEVATLDPHAARGIPEQRVLRCLYEGLVSRAPRTLEPAPGVASSWEVSEDGRRYLFHLRPEARWSNGDPLTAEDFRWSLMRALDPETAAPGAQELHAIRGALDYAMDALASDGAPDAARVGVTALDAHTLEVLLEEPLAYFLEVLSLPAAFPVHRASVEALQASDPLHWRTQWTRPENLVTNGPFRLALRRPGDRMRLARNAHYWAVDSVAFDTIDVLALSHWGTLFNLYVSGEVDWIDGMIPATLVQQLRGREDYRRTPYLGSYFYRVNTTKPPLDDPRVRRALALAIPRRVLCAQLLGAGQIEQTTIVPWGGIGAYRSPEVLDDRDGIALARELLSEAGFGKGRAEFPPIVLHYNTSESHRDIAEVVAEVWGRELGVPVTLENQEWKVYLDTQVQLGYDVSRSSWIADHADPIGFLQIFTTGNENNRTGWSSPSFDALIAAARETAPGPERDRLLGEAETILLEELPVLPVYSYVSQHLVAPRLGGFHGNSLNEHSPRHLYWMDDAELATARNDRQRPFQPPHGPSAGKYSPAERARRAERAAAGSGG